MASFPVPEQRLRQIAQDACDEALRDTTAYLHASTNTWNNTIIGKVLESLVSETSPESGAASPFKFAVTSTIIQHKSSSVDAGTRGMNSSMGAYWNSQKDGMWSYKYEHAHEKGMDVVVHVVWIGL